MKLSTILRCILLFGISFPFALAGSIAENCKRFGTIVIHRVNFKNESPADVVAFLNLNWKNTDPHVKGMDLKLAPDAFNGKEVTLSATDMKFSELVGRVAEQLDAVVMIQSDSILLIPDDGEQGGTGQPATRTQSKSEGSRKPKPEAEGRSR
jgi:hypothetical protein